MAQGHALSVLRRAHFLTNNSIYISSAKNALKLFKIVNFLNKHYYYKKNFYIDGFRKWNR